MAKKKVARPTPAEQGLKLDPHRLDATVIALSKARAAGWLLNEIHYKGAAGIFDTAFDTQEEADAVCGWLHMMGHEYLVQALDEAEAAYRTCRNAKAAAA